MENDGERSCLVDSESGNAKMGELRRGPFETSGEQRRRTRGTVTASLDVDKGRSKEDRKDVLRVPSINTFTLFAEHL